MKNVYFKKINNYEDKDTINNTCYEMLEKIVKLENFELDKTIPLKVHFGEMGNNTFITPDNFAGIKRFLNERNINSCYIDTNVLYKGSRTIESDHIKTAISHGFTDLDIVIADGNEDKPYTLVPIDGHYFKECMIGSKYADYNQFIVLAHFKGHCLAGIGASIKQLAMGFASRGGKLNQHSDSIPIINNNKCISCGSCVRKCPVSAITLPEKAVINPKICIGCASCTNVCPVRAISNTWDGANFYEKLAEYAYAATIGKKNIYFNFAFNITENCDCEGEEMEIIAPNIGIFVSTDPVAIDSSTLTEYEKLTNNNNFSSAWKTIEHAEKIGLGESSYNLIEL